MCGKNSSESSPNSQDNRDLKRLVLYLTLRGGPGQVQGGDQGGGHGGGHSRSYSNRAEDTGSALSAGDPPVPVL